MSSEGEIITCLAAVAFEANRPLSVENIQVLPPRHGEVRIKVVTTGIVSYFLSKSSLSY
jgi:S-(hydroxymethyl)glutathione dehydrogenase / alcohol dehydrogenase